MDENTLMATPEINPCDVQVRLDGYIDMVQGKNDEYFKAAGFTFADPPQIMATFGKKYAKIVKVDQLNGSRSVHTFVNMLNGDILKSGSYKAPQINGVRGNIFAEDFGADRVSEHGTYYVKPGRKARS